MRRPLILNVVLAATVVSLAVWLHNDWIIFDAQHQPGAIQPLPESLPKLGTTPTGNASAAVDWTEIPSHNPFSFDRNDIAILEPAAAPKPPGAKPILFGTIDLGSGLIAMVAPGQPGNRNYKPMKVGEVIDGWTVTQILDKSIVIKADSIEDSVIMSDPTAQVQRDSTRTTASAPTPTVSSVSQPAPSQSLLPPPSSSGLLPATPQPATPGQPRTRRRITQQTPFGVREIEIEE